MAFAPSVSIEYWQELAERHTAVLEGQQSLEAPLAAIVSNQCDKAVQMFVQNEEYEDGKVVKALQMCGLMRSTLDKIQLKDGQALQPLPDNATQEQFRAFDFGGQAAKGGKLPGMARLAEKESETLFYQGKTLLAAAVLLSINDFKGTV